MVRAGLGIGAAAAALRHLRGASAFAAPASVPPTSATTLVLQPETGPVWLFAALLGLGAAAQAAGMARGWRAPVLLGAAAVVGAGVWDQDPVLVVGQLALLAALWPGMRARSRAARAASEKK